MTGRMRIVTVLLLAGVIPATAMPRTAAALETDQFTVPPAPLADVGPELATEMMARIEGAVRRVNARAAAHARRAASARGFWHRHHLRERDRAGSEEAVSREVYKALAGPWVPECRIEQWLRRHEFARGPSRFELKPGDSAYGPSPFARSALILNLSPTVNVYGVYCGADKVGHLFQQGYEYYEQFAREESRRLARGEPAARATDAALASAVRLGIGQEEGLYGLALVGVYSNADLAANYAGLKLYLNLTRPVAVAGAVRPPLLVRGEGGWVLNPRVGGVRGPTQASAFLRPFISDHFNEALNPSRYRGPADRTIRARWQQRAAAWVAFYHSTRAIETKRLARLAAWHGEPYGHSGFDDLVTAADTCFGPAPLAAHSPAAAGPSPRAARPTAESASGLGS